jgi:hypothetical protein
VLASLLLPFSAGKRPLKYPSYNISMFAAWLSPLIPLDALWLMQDCEDAVPNGAASFSAVLVL